MSYNVDSTEYIGGTGPLTITAAAHDELRAEINHLSDTAEVSWFTQKVAVTHSGFGTVFNVVKPWWYGQGSGRAFDMFVKSLTYTRGSADILVTWEGGDSFSGLRVRDGVVTRHEIVHALGEEEKA
jgi:hypothetical protein